MHTHDPERVAPQPPPFPDDGNCAGERGIAWVVALTAAMMVVGDRRRLLTNSMALLADGLHMSSHALATRLECSRLCRRTPARP